MPTPTSFFQFNTNGPVTQSTIPTSQYATGGGGAITTQANDDSNTKSSTTQFLGEPMAVWLGMILLLIILKFASQSPKVNLLGENVNPAHIRIGGYNWLAIGVSAATFIIIFKVLANYKTVPGLTPFANAL